MILAFFKRPLGWAVLAVIVVLLLWAGYRALTRDAHTEARLGKNQAEAAQQSGSDAVNTVGAAAERKSAGEDLTRSNDAAIRAAPGATDAVSAEARAAGFEALCKRQAYKDHPRCAR